MKRLILKANATVSDIVGYEEVDGQKVPIYKTTECNVEFIGISFFKILKGNPTYQFYDYKQVSNIRNLQYETRDTANFSSSENISPELIDHSEFIESHAKILDIEESALINILLSYCDRFYVRIFIETYKMSEEIERVSPKNVLASIRNKLTEKVIKKKK